MTGAPGHLIYSIIAIYRTLIVAALGGQMVHYLLMCSPFSGDSHIWLLAKYPVKHLLK